MILKVIHTVALSLVLLGLVTLTTAAQQKRQTPVKAPPKPVAVATPTPAPTFDTLLSADCYKIYVEVRGAGQLIHSNSVNEILEPVMQLAAPSKEFKQIVKWLNKHADEVTTSRMFVALWPTAQEVPPVLIAIEFASPEEAAKFQPQLDEFLPKVMPASGPEEPPSGNGTGVTAQATSAQRSTAQPAPSPEKPKETTPPKPNYYLTRTGSLILVTPAPLTLKKLRPAGSKLLAEDVNFRMTRNRFSNESIFAFIDVKGMEAESQREVQVAKQADESFVPARQVTTKVSIAEEASKKDDEQAAKEEAEIAEREELERNAQLQAKTTGKSIEPDPVSTAFASLGTSLFSGRPNWPDAVGVAISLDADSFDARALLVNAPGKTSDPVPFIPILVPGSAIVPESPSILPADTELFVTLSLDLPQMHATLSKPPLLTDNRGNLQTAANAQYESPFAAIEKLLKIKINEDVLPLLGSEVSVSLPIPSDIVPSRPTPTAGTKPDDDQAATRNKPPERSPVVAISLRDREGMKLLFPKLLEGLGMKGLTAMAQTERREDTELVSLGEFGYAFVGNFLVISPDAKATRKVVDSYLKHETLSSNLQFKNYTRWQPRQVQGQVYVSPALMESYRSWAQQPSTTLTDQLREMLTRLSVVSQPITYTLANEGLGHLHELHLPKNLVLMMVAGISSENNPPEDVANERTAIAAMYMISQAEIRYKTDKGGSFVTLEQLLSENMVPEEYVKAQGYKIQLIASGTKFEVTAVPIEYGKGGKMSYFVDESGVVRGGDHAGGPATVSDNPVN